MSYYQPPDGVILDALEHDLAQWHAAQAQRDITDLRRISDRLRQRGAEVPYLDDRDKYVKADGKLQSVESELEPYVPARAPVVAVLPKWALRDDETHWQRWWPTYLGVAAGGLVLTLVVWFVLALIEALAALVAAVASLVMGAVGVLALIAVIVFLAGLGGGGGKGFTFSGSGRLH